MTAKRFWILAAIAAWLGASAPVRAEDGAVLVRGAIGEPDRQLVGAAFEAVTRGAGWVLPAKALPKREAEALLACVSSSAPWACMPKSLRGLQRVVVVEVERRTSEGAPLVALTARALVPSERVLVVGERFCERCASAELGTASTELAYQLLRDLAVRAGRTRVAIKSDPPGAQIILNGDRIGATDAALSTYPGTHLVILEKPGFAVESREVAVAEGQTAELMVRMRPAAPVPRPVPRPPTSRLVPGVVLGAGAAVLATGVVLLAVDDDVTTAGAQSARNFDSARYGAGYAIAGAAVTAAGAYWWIRRTQARRAPTLAVTGVGASIGWQGTF
jgi:hypothetical protein